MSFYRTLLVISLLVLTTSSSLLALTAAEVFELDSPRVATIKVKSPSGASLAQGSGVVIGPDAVITNYHVVAVNSSPSISVILGNRSLPGKIVYVDVDRDLCQLAVVGANVKPVEIGPLSEVKVGSSAFSVGSPEGFELTLSQGIVSSIREYRGLGRIIQTSAPISHGSSGGGLFDDRGRLIGITTLMSESGQNLNFAMPAEWVSDLPQTTEYKTDAELPLLLASTIAAKRQDYATLSETATNWVSLNPHQPRALILLASALLAQGKLGPAFDTCEQAMKVIPKSNHRFRSVIMLYLGMICQDRKDYKRALVHFSDYLAEREGYSPKEIVTASTMIVACHLRLGDPGRALAALQDSEKLAPGDPSLLLLRGGVLEGEKQYTQAIDAYKAIVQAVPDQPTALLGLGRCYLELNRPQEALEALWGAKDSRSSGARVWMKIGRAYEQLSAPKKALWAYYTASRKDAKLADAWLKIGHLNSAVGQDKAAVRGYQGYLRLRPKDKTVWTALSAAYLKQKEFMHAAKTFEKLVELDPGDAYKWYVLGSLYQHVSEFPKAIPVLERANQLDPGRSKILFKLGLAYAQNNKRPEVAQVLQKLKVVDLTMALRLRDKARVLLAR